MNTKKLRQRLERLRREAKSGLRSARLEALAKALGRVRVDRGDHPTYVNVDFRDLRPVSIPHHSKPLKAATAKSILDSLEQDLERLEEENGHES